MKSHDLRNALVAAAGVALLAGPLTVSASATTERMEYQGQATANHGPVSSPASLKSLLTPTDTRSGAARLLVCGDSEPDAGEECDDGNTTSGDGCSATCTIEAGFDCSAAVASNSNILADGSFEDGNVGGEWTSITHSLFGPDLICGDGCFGAPFAAGPDGSLVSGNYVLIAGGSFQSNSVGSAVHAAVSIPANATTLEFQWATLASGAAGQPCAGNGDGIALHIGGTGGTGGTEVWRNDLPCTNVNPYQRVAIDLSAVDGLGDIRGTTTEFYFTASATGVPPNVDLTNVMLDDVSINTDTPITPPIPSACSAVVCGDGQFPQFSAAGSEECDDGNLVSGDGCSATCTVEQPNFVCEDPIPAAASGNDVQDSGLEDGVPNGFWTETGTAFEPICSQVFCGAALADTGAFYAWFGGTSDPAGNTQSLSQDVTISTSSTDVSWRMLVGRCDNDGGGVNDDTLEISIDGNVIYTETCTTTATYQNFSAEIPAGFRDGGVHTLTFTSTTTCTNPDPGTGQCNTNRFVDNIRILDNVAFPGAPGTCFELDPACDTIEEFDGAFPPAGWTVHNGLNGGSSADDGWGATTDGICGTQNWSAGDPLAPGYDPNVTGGGGSAACADSDATGQIDLDGGATTPTEMDTYLCSPAIDLANVTDPVFSFLVNYQAADNDLNDNGTPGDTSDDFDDDFLQVLVGDQAPNPLTLPSYTPLGNVFDHLDSTLALSEEAALRANLADQQVGGGLRHVCFHYRGTYAWFAQIDNAGLRGSACVAPPDSDGDGVPDGVDNCTFVPNAAQIDSDGDGHGNTCDQDLNQDCQVNPIDLGIFRAAFFGNSSPTPNWNPDSDFNGDNQTNPVDLGIFRAAFFQPVPQGAPGALCNP